MKKAISPLISWVLLIGMVVAVGALVSNWAIKQAQRINVTEIAEGGLYCDGVALSVDAVCKVSENEGIKNIKLKLKNRGNFKISNVYVDLKDDNGIKSEKTEWSLDPGDELIKDIFYQMHADYIKLTPLIKIEGNLMTCGEKKVLLSENDVLNNIKDCCGCGGQGPNQDCISICPLE